jgi:hypothetical protein
MRVLTFAFGILALFTSPALCSAGPIQFQITPTGFWVDPDRPMLSSGLYPLFEGGTFVVDPSTGTATRVGPLVGFDLSRLPPPRPIDLKATGSAFWDEHALFHVDFRLTDLASGQSADLSMWGLAHGHAYISTGNPWNGGAGYWFSDGVKYATLGDSDYVIWGQQRLTAEQPELSVWVGENPPFPWAPEPGTFALAALGLAPLATRAVRRFRSVPC